MDFTTRVTFGAAIMTCLLALGCKPSANKKESSQGSIVKAATLAGIDPQEAEEMAALAQHSQRETQVAPYFVDLTPLGNSQVKGLIMLNSAPSGKGVRLVGWVLGLVAEGTFGLSIYEQFQCKDMISSGTPAHFNPNGAPHGNPASDAPHHLGDLPNLIANQRGVSRVDMLVPDINLSTNDPLSVGGRVLVVHRDPDDFTTQPLGNSGPPLGCGVISDQNKL